MRLSLQQESETILMWHSVNLITIPEGRSCEARHSW